MQERRERYCTCRRDEGKRDAKNNGIHVGYRCGYQRYAEVTYMM